MEKGAWPSVIAGTVHLLSRNRIRLNEKYPEIVAAFRNQPPDEFVADGEVATFERGVTSFARLQHRMQVAKPSPERRRNVPVWLYLFDLLYVDGYDVRRVPLRFRKRLLRAAFRFRGSLRFTEHRQTEGETYYQDACRRRREPDTGLGNDERKLANLTQACSHD